MTLPTPDQLRDLSREELIALVGQQAEQIARLSEQVRQLTETVQRLQAENRRLKHPPTSSRNTSQPPRATGKRTPGRASGHGRRSAAPNRAMPKPSVPLSKVHAQFTNRITFKVTPPEAYENHLRDGKRVDVTFFMRDGQVGTAWSIVISILDGWANKPLDDSAMCPAGMV